MSAMRFFVRPSMRIVSLVLASVSRALLTGLPCLPSAIEAYTAVVADLRPGVDPAGSVWAVKDVGGDVVYRVADELGHRDLVSFGGVFPAITCDGWNSDDDLDDWVVAFFDFGWRDSQGGELIDHSVNSVAYGVVVVIGHGLPPL